MPISPHTIFEAPVLSDPTETMGAALRARAARLNAMVVTGGCSLATLSTESDLSKRDQSLLRAMLAASLRWHHRHEWQLSQLLDRPLKPKDNELAALLRIGLAQIEALRIPDHAAVSATVAATSDLGLSRASGLVNAVLRRYLRERSDLAERCMMDEVARFSHPKWIIDALKSDWPSNFESILEANNALPPFWLRVNRTRINRRSYLDRLEAAGIEASIHEPFEDAVLITEPCPVHELAGFDDGFVSVQDAAAQRAADLMQLAPGQRVLDACAAPGGKTAHMLERCPELSEMVAVDRDAGRLQQIQENLERLGLKAKLVAGNAMEPDDWFEGERFDRVLVDAPCSGTGVIRRHPDIKILRRADDLSGLTNLQGQMLDALWALLAPGGLMVYATCSVLRSENCDVVHAFAERTVDARLSSLGTPGHFQLESGKANADGFYYACLSKGQGGD